MSHRRETGQPAVVGGAIGQGRYVYSARLFAETIRQGLPALRVPDGAPVIFINRRWVDAAIVEATLAARCRLCRS
jgi:hypothetical protein